MKPSITKSICAAFILIGAGLSNSLAQAQFALTGMPGYQAEVRAVVDFGIYREGYIFDCAPEKPCTGAVDGFNDEGKLMAEGKVTEVHYATQKPAGTLAVLRNYENAIRAAGGSRLTYTATADRVNVFLLERQGAKTWVVLDNALDGEYTLTYIEARPMQQVIKASALAQAIEKQGYATLYVNFDTNKSDIKPDAMPALDEVVALLKGDSALRLSIEGHTDNVGVAAANKTLSQARAQSVVKALIAGGIDGKRLQAKGFGSENPVADNRSEEGRAKNRRVELVKVE